MESALKTHYESAGRMSNHAGCTERIKKLGRPGWTPFLVSGPILYVAARNSLLLVVHRNVRNFLSLRVC